MLLKKGDTGQDVKELQTKLNAVVGVALVIDGIFGQETHLIVCRFQADNNLTVDGIVGDKTNTALNNQYNQINDGYPLLNFGADRFVVFVDAGHGGIDDAGQYVTSGKRAYHEGVELHQAGHYYEGYENRIIAEAYIEALTQAGINSVRVYHPVRDTSLYDRTNLINSYLKRGYYGFLLSFHSNAISSSNSPEKLENTRGFSVYTTKGDTLSDKIAEVHFQHAVDTFTDWTLRTQKSVDNDSDYEENFQILRETDTPENSGRFGAILEEFGFHTSKNDCLYIIGHRKNRVKCAVKTAKKVKELMTNKI